ncbi:MAG: glycosyl hydrolase family 28-related protein [Segetibacter sp.]
MIANYTYTIIILIFSTLTVSAHEQYGARITWTTYEAEKMKTNGTVMGPAYTPFRVETESSGQQCVKLSSRSQYIEFTASINANSIVVRYSLPDKKEGGGKQSTFGIYKNGKFIEHRKISSHYSWLYGKYPFTNNPDSGKPRNFYDEIRIKDLQIAKGDIIRIQRDDHEGDDAEYCIIDLADLDSIAPPLKAPSNSLSITDKTFVGSDSASDYTEALRKCIATAMETGKSVWIPSGTFKITGDIVLPSNIIIQGAGMWHSTLIGDETLYTDANKRVRLKGNGSNIRLSDFAIIGKLNYRNDKEPNDGIVGSYGTNSTISRIWIEHTKVGMWVENSKNLIVEDSRLRNTIADGINFCVGMTQSTIQNCAARGTGDDCFAFWPAVFAKQEYVPGKNLITHCTAQLPFLANGAAIYGGQSNQIKNCSFIDISPGSAILISTTFPTEDSSKNINNNFSGTTVIEDCNIKTSGGFDHEWGWRAAVQICLDKRNISGIDMSNLTIGNSLSDGLSVIAKNVGDKAGVLSNVTLKNIEISTYGIGVKGKHGLWIASDAHGSLTLRNPAISETKNDSKSFAMN